VDPASGSRNQAISTLAPQYQTLRLLRSRLLQPPPSIRKFVVIELQVFGPLRAVGQGMFPNARRQLPDCEAGRRHRWPQMDRTGNSMRNPLDNVVNTLPQGFDRKIPKRRLYHRVCLAFADFSPDIAVRDLGRL